MDVLVTGIGPIPPNCNTRHTLWQQLRDGASQLRFEPVPDGDGNSDGGDRWAVGRIDDFDPGQWLGRFPRNYYQRYHRELQLYLASLVVALDDAGLDLAQVSRERTGLFDGTSRGSFEYWYERIRDERRCPPAELYSRRDLLLGTPGQSASLAASLLGVRGPAFTFSITCCSGAVALGHAYRELVHGDLDVALATGHDSALAAPIYHAYREAGLLSSERGDARRAIRPFADGSRNAFGEGAVTLVLETAEHAARRGATPLARIAGFKYGNNGGHPLDIDREGGRASALIGDVLRSAAVERDRIGFVVGHGNGVEQSDRSELAYMRQVFGDRAGDVPLLSVKPIYGHLLGGSSALSVAAAAMMLDQRWLVPTANAPAAGNAPIDHAGAGGRRCDAGAALTISYGIGGHNAVTLLTRAEAA